jgi:purine nucleosidase
LMERRDLFKLLFLTALPAVVPQSARAGDQVRVVWDTDIGTDIDDALCLAYLCREKRCELTGITTTSSQPEQRARLAKALVESMGRPETPVHPGGDRKINGGRNNIKVPQAAALAQWQCTWKPEPESAIPFLIQTIKADPGKITLLATGPLTNIARLLEEMPDAFDYFQAIYLMNGYFGPAPFPEYNAAVDAPATARVYAALKNARVVGID